jgi:hypothetical protein
MRMDTVNATLLGRAQRLLAVGLVAMLAAACSSSNGPNDTNSGISLGSASSANDPVSPDFAIAYIKRTLPKAGDPNAITLNTDLRAQRVWNGPADVWVRERASPTANEKNITASIACPLASDPNPASGPDHDVRDLDASFDGKKLVFSLRCRPIKNQNKQSQQPRWTIFEYDVATATVRQVIADPIAAALGHDVGPHYLPDGRIVFSSSRQHDAKAVLIDEGKAQFAAGIEGNRNLPAFVVHVMNADGSGIRQLSFNTGHDLDPSVLTDGRVVFTRWDINSAAGMHLYAIDPDGGDLQLLYGRNSHDTGNPTSAQGGSLVQFTQARARPDGKVVALLLPFAGTDFGGDIALLDSANFVENLQTVLGAKVQPGATGQVHLVVNDVITTAAPAADPNAPAGTPPPFAPPSPGGRFASVYPLWDGTNRLLVSWSQCRLTLQTLVLPCTSDNLVKTGVVPAPTIYSIWIYDPNNNTQLPVVTPVEGVMYSNAVALQPRLPTPSVIPDAQPSATGSYTFGLAAEGVGILDIKSVYDFDGVDTAPGGIAAVRDPTKRMASPTRPRFVRVEKAVSLPDVEVLTNNAFPAFAFGAAGNFMREIIGYAPVEPDGSVRLKVPSNIPFQISLLDANGRRLDGTYPRHRAWMQIRTGETVVCNGCHVQQPLPPSSSHGRTGLFATVNTGAPVSGQPFPNTMLQVTDRTGAVVAPPRQPNAGETMAEYRAAMQVTCVDAACASHPAVDLVFSDVWTLPGPPPVGTPDPAFSWTYAQLGTPAPVRADCATNWQGNCRITIHYPLHIAPLWTSPRVTIKAVDPTTTMPYATCTGCHAPKTTAGVKQVPAGQLDLSSTPASTTPCDQREFTSFCQLLFPHPQLDPVTMLPVLVPGPPDPVTGLPTMVVLQVNPPMSGAGANASAAFFNEFAAGGTHAGWLTGAELKLISEWLDIGGQYYNDPFAIPPAN